MSQDIERAFEQRLSQRNRAAKGAGSITTIYSRKQIEQALLETFELVGGVSRLALWANDPENYGKFLDLWLRLAPKGVPELSSKGSVTYISNVPQSPLNRNEQPTESVLIEQPPEEN